MLKPRVFEAGSKLFRCQILLRLGRITAAGLIKIAIGWIIIGTAFWLPPARITLLRFSPGESSPPGGFHSIQCIYIYYIRNSPKYLYNGTRLFCRRVQLIVISYPIRHVKIQYIRIYVIYCARGIIT